MHYREGMVLTPSRVQRDIICSTATMDMGELYTNNVGVQVVVDPGELLDMETVDTSAVLTLRNHCDHQPASAVVDSEAALTVAKQAISVAAKTNGATEQPAAETAETSGAAQSVDKQATAKTAEKATTQTAAETAETAEISGAAQTIAEQSTAVAAETAVEQAAAETAEISGAAQMAAEQATAVAAATTAK